jgi:hypothetical protein
MAADNSTNHETGTAIFLESQSLPTVRETGKEGNNKQEKQSEQGKGSQQ